MSKHTPGPWQQSPRGLSVFIEGSDLSIVATCGIGGVHRDGIGHANARLIAAAPELLDALKRAVWLCGQVVEPECLATAQELIARIESPA